MFLFKKILKMVALLNLTIVKISLHINAMPTLQKPSQASSSHTEDKQIPSTLPEVTSSPSGLHQENQRTNGWCFFLFLV